MPNFPIDAPLHEVIRALKILGFELVREGNHIALNRSNSDGSKTPLTIPNHPYLKISTLRTILSQSGISREDFLRVYKG